MTPNFSRAELTCKCGCGRMEIPLEFVLMLERVRARVGFPMRISSGYRCPDYNERISSTGRDGPHTKAAVDVAVSGKDALRVLLAALREGFTGIGVQQKGTGRFIHLDRRVDPTIWSY